jgi:hypothetical protein
MVHHQMKIAMFSESLWLSIVAMIITQGDSDKPYHRLLDLEKQADETICKGKWEWQSIIPGKKSLPSQIQKR